MEALLETPKKERNWEFVSGDEKILGAFRYDPLIQSIQLPHLVDRQASLKVFTRRLQALREGGLLKRFSPRKENEVLINAGHFGHTPTAKGWRKIAELGLAVPQKAFDHILKPGVWVGTDIKTNKNFDHDNKLTNDHIEIVRDFDEDGWVLDGWEPLAAFIHIANDEGFLIPDRQMAFISPRGVDGRPYVERENSDQNVRDGKSSIEKKMDIYNELFRTKEKDGFVIFIMRSELLALNECKRLQAKGGHYSSDRFWFTWPGAGKWTERRFITPHDFHKGFRYSLED